MRPSAARLDGDRRLSGTGGGSGGGAGADGGAGIAAVGLDEGHDHLVRLGQSGRAGVGLLVVGHDVGMRGAHQPAVGGARAARSVTPRTPSTSSASETSMAGAL